MTRRLFALLVAEVCQDRCESVYAYDGSERRVSGGVNPEECKYRDKRGEKDSDS